MKSKLVLGMACVALFFLSACQMFDKKEKKSSEESVVKQLKAPNEDIRLKFNQIKLGHLVTDFKGGATAEELVTLFGQPTHQEQIPAGENVTLDAYTWQFDNVTVSARLFENSTISRTISNFSFIREERLSLADFESIEDEEDYKSIIERFGQPDVMSESVSSDKETIQAIWTSNLIYDKNNPFIELNFENNILVKKVQNGLKKVKQ